MSVSNDGTTFFPDQESSQVSQSKIDTLFGNLYDAGASSSDQAAAQANGWNSVKDGFKDALIAIVNHIWPLFATTHTLRLSNGVDTTLDPLNLDGLAHGGGGPCPWACGTASLTQVAGLKNAAVDPTQTFVGVRTCDGAAIHATLPIDFPNLSLTADAKWSLLLTTHQWPQAGLAWKNLKGTLNVVLPMVLNASTESSTTAVGDLVDGATDFQSPFQISDSGGASHNKYEINFAGASVSVVLDITALDTTTSTASWFKPLLNEALAAGGATMLQNLAERKLGDMFTQDMQSFFVQNNWSLNIPMWLLNGLAEPIEPPTSQTCRAVHNVPAEMLTPCDPCDVCCLCATQNNCSSALCRNGCKNCMTSGCKRVIPWKTVLEITGVLGAALLLVLLMLFLLYKGAKRVIKGGSKPASKSNFTSSSPTAAFATASARSTSAVASAQSTPSFVSPSPSPFKSPSSPFKSTSSPFFSPTFKPSPSLFA